jgi:hypothetical protein
VDEINQNKLVEIELGRDVERRLDRINAIEKAADLLRSRFDGLLEQLSREAITDEDIEKLEKKWEKALNEAISNIRLDFKAANDLQSKDIVGEFRGALHQYRNESKDEQLHAQKAVLEAINQSRSRWKWWVLGIVAAVLTTIISAEIAFLMFGRLN